ncbi:isocitrate lyase/phosphoenolpyruvate mutase family protein [Actinomadura viridis]|uniref:2-methylisocitrate lyase-like PEP mutase family enzyme n=1 Tax=Actinomadura viridis TaxID=58110 RepID=A0A931DM77_9ACTN|nr:isocitrate lyase/phosphoenolpyruvate mutase family protein [Actinomadura viridis]MBG6090161.1 2-methylisocitrate lyase-like PEP mutase family enzyme [Actinomadura viridis]
MKTRTFHDLHHGERPLLLPNVWSFASGAAMVEAGFPAVGTTSLGVAATAGKPDAAGGTRAETLALARGLARLPVPVTIDVEAGFSDRPEEVAALAADLASWGIAGVNIEDGRPGGVLAPPDDQCALITAVKAAAPDLFVNARTDCHWLPGHTAQTLDRVRAYTEAGADGIFVPGLAGETGVRAAVAATHLPLNVLFLPGGATFDELAAMGVRRVSYGSLLYRTALHAAVVTAVEGRAPAGIPTYDDVQRLVSA